MTLVRGIRRIQEVYTDPLLDLGEAYAQGEGGAQQAFNEDPELDPEGLTGGSEQGQTETGGTGDPGDPGDPQAPPVVYLAREYVWGPGDGPGSGTGIYELLAIFDLERRPWWAVQDAGQDVVALIDAGATTPGGSSGGPGVGNGFGDGSNSAARLVGEFSYTAYGELLTAASHAPHPDPRLGHKGLFLDRLDTGVVDPLSGAEVARHVLGAKHTYYTSGRHYDPILGRWLQRDPNSTGLPLIAEVIYAGSALGNDVNSFGLEGHIGDGVNVYGYLSGNPWTGSDPLGLYDEFSIVDNYLAEEAGSKAAFMETLVVGFDTITQVASQLAQMHPAIGMAMSIHSVITTGKLDLWTFLGALPGAKALVGAKRVTEAKQAFAGASGALQAARLSYAERGTRGLTRRAINRFQDALSKITSGPRHWKVYIGRRSGEAVYVGITNNVAVRQRQHGGRFVITPLFTNLTKPEALFIEQTIMLNNPHFENKIQSSLGDALREIYDVGIGWAETLLRKHGYSGKF